MRIGFIGLGNMGAAIAASLLRASHELAVWNRTANKAAPLLELGAIAAATPREVAADREVVFSMLADDAALRAVLAGEDGLLAGLSPGAVHISLSTIGVATADETASSHRERGQHFVCAPVFGRPQAAAEAKLFVVAAGAAAELLRVKPLLEDIGQKLFVVGEKPSAANLVKLCGNFMILAAIESLGEAMALADKGGVAKSALLEVLTGTLFDSAVYRTYGAILIEERFRPAGFAAPLGLKDMRLVGAEAQTAHLPMPVLQVLQNQLRRTIEREGADIDWSGIALTAASST